MLAEALDPFEEARLDDRLGDLEDLGDLLPRETLDVAKAEDLALAGREPGHELPQPGAELLAHEPGQMPGQLGGRHALARQRLVVPPAGAAAEEIETAIAGDPVDPGAEALGDGLRGEHLAEDVLYRVLRLLDLTEIPGAEAQEVAPVELLEELAGGAVAGPEPPDEARREVVSRRGLLLLAHGPVPSTSMTPQGPVRRQVSAHAIEWIQVSSRHCLAWGSRMGCEVSREQLWSWVDRDAPELAGHLAVCAGCRARAAEIRSQIGLIAADTQALTIPLPERIGNYTIKRLIGEGGQALVYEAEQASPRRAVAVKVLKGGRFIGARELRRFQREIQALAALHHPGIATIHEAGQAPEGQHYLAMELVQGTWLHVYLREQSPPRRARLELFRKICDAVQYAHRHGVVHLDLKPTNILIDEDGQPKVLDFGLARIRHGEPDRTLTETNVVAGTPRYMSPEQICGQRDEVDGRADVYALGAILYEMLTGRPPHDVSALTPEAIRTVCEEAPARPSTLDRSLSGDLESILLRALAKSPADRYASVADLAADVECHLRGEVIADAKAAGRPVRWAATLRKIRTERRWRWRLGAAAAFALAAALSLAYGFRAPYDRMAARMEIAELNSWLFHEEPDPLRVAAAIAALKRFPELRDAVLLAAHGNVIDGEYRFAIELLREGLARDPSAWPYRALLSEINTRLARPEAAGLWNEETEAGQLATAEDWYLRSLATLDRRVALRSAREAVRRDPEHPCAMLALTRLAVLDGDYAAAADGAAALEHLGEDVSYWKGERSDFLGRLDRYAEALGAADSALAMSPGNFHSFYRRAVLHRRLKHHRPAIEDFTRAIQLAGEGNSAWIVYHRGTMHWLAGQPEEAVADYRRASDILGFATYGSARMVLILRELGRGADADSALAEARRGVLQDGQLAEILSCLAGEITPAALVAAADPADPRQQCEVCYYAAELNLAAGRIEAARDLFQRCIETGVRSDPDNTIEPMSEYELAEWRLTQLSTPDPS